MKFGSIVWLRRGSISRTKGLGKARFVLARFLFARGNQVFCELLENDPFACSKTKKGEKGWWSKNSIRSLTLYRPKGNEKNYLV